MTDRTTKLQLPYILPSQAQKHVTHNEALQRLDAVVQLVIADVPATPPSSPEEGDCFLIAENATGDWSGNAGKLAFRQDGAWLIMQPKPGWTAWFAEAGRYRVLQDGSWQDMPLPATGRMDRLGIGTDADATNRFALASPASLFTHTNGDHRMTINKAGSADTASLLFQSGWSGRAEMGLAGNDGFSIKTSADGATWQTALSSAAADTSTCHIGHCCGRNCRLAIFRPSTGHRPAFPCLRSSRVALRSATMSARHPEKKSSSPQPAFISLRYRWPWCLHPAIRYLSRSMAPRATCR
ncbi:DUF2793 domain-containing protein [Agrobacterium tumefaciens]|uniref:DUF2793 domain-containing protein n=1 Tax=Agrobacterium tumefaciens TaxID=358 RepID=UPI00287D1AE0|nr:DUF2793 domain-containing protein [Agrobacterium tumefaciens]MDS7597844.1 DUF2793 domain-containing protein [Agrobacterium tumefaciens]